MGGHEVPPLRVHPAFEEALGIRVGNERGSLGQRTGVSDGRGWRGLLRRRLRRA
jgi:hypothetical protein